MKPKYWIEHDGMQWQLFVEKDATDKEGAINRRTSGLGWFPKFHQAIGKMYEMLCAGWTEGTITCSEILEAVKKAEQIKDDLIREFRGKESVVAAPIVVEDDLEDI